MKAVLMVLELLAEIEWARCINGAVASPAHPPLLAWRFKSPNPDMEDAIARAVASYKGSMVWSMEMGNRNWVIAPLAFMMFSRSFQRDVEALRRFGIEFLAETTKAMEDVTGLATHLRSTLLSN